MQQYSEITEMVLRCFRQAPLKAPYRSEEDIIEGVKEQNFVYLKQSIQELCQDGVIRECGFEYSKEFKKLFKVYTSLTGELEDLKKTILIGQAKRQYTSLVRFLLNELKEHKHVAKIQETLDFFKTGKSKRSLKYFAMSDEDIILAHQHVIKNGQQILEDALAKKEEREPRKVLQSQYN